ncbi:RNA ligase [compost metagenome]
MLDEVVAHPNADLLDLVTIGGWRVVAQKGLYVTGDVAVYFEVDSWIPTEIAPFLSKGKEPKVYEGVKGERLRTIKLRGELSQGLLIPVKELPQLGNLLGFVESAFAASDLKSLNDFVDGNDLTETLGILKWEKAINANLAGLAKGNFPNFLRKSDQERVQNLSRQYREAVANGEESNVTYKLDGSSFTGYLREHYDGTEDVITIGVCSRNLDLKFEGNEGNLFVQTFIKYDIEAKLRAYHQATGRSIAVQGEMVGPGIQANFEGLDEIKLFVYNVFDIDKQQYLLAGEARHVCNDLGLEMVPTFNVRMTLPETIGEVLLLADGDSGLSGKFREGLVFKSLTRNFQFKAVSNRYLLETGK